MQGARNRWCGMRGCSRGAENLHLSGAHGRGLDEPNVAFVHSFPFMPICELSG